MGSGRYVYLCDAVTGRRLAVHHGPTRGCGFIFWRTVWTASCIASASPRRGCERHSPLGWRERQRKVAVLRGHTAYVTSSAFSARMGHCCFRGADTRITRRLASGTRLRGWLLFVLAGHKNEINTVAFSPDGKRVATSSADQTAALGRALGRVAGRPARWAYTDRVRHVLFSPNGTRIVTASGRCDTSLLERPDGRNLIGVCRGHGDGFAASPVFTRDGSRLVSGSADGTKRIWDMGAGGTERHPEGTHELRLRCRLQPQRRAGGVGGVGRLRTPLGCHDRPANRSAAARDGDHQFGGLPPRRTPTRYDGAGTGRHALGCVIPEGGPRLAGTSCLLGFAPLLEPGGDIASCGGRPSRGRFNFGMWPRGGRLPDSRD